ncbi:MAG: peptidase, partial [Alphaproteobacteria bacterium]
GGVLALSLLLFRRLPLLARLARHGWIATLHDKAQGVPYGIALAAGALLAWPDLLTVPGQ